MYRIAGQIEGLAPILFNKPDPVGISSGNSKKLSAAEKTAEAEDRLYVDEVGVYWPSANLEKAIFDGAGAAGLKEGRTPLGKRLLATVFVEREPHFVGKTTHDRMFETLVRIPPRTGALVLKGRPQLDEGWRLDFILNVLDDRRSPEAIRLALEAAGVYIGMGSWRPKYGRFAVTQFEVLAPAKSKR